MLNSCKIVSLVDAIPYALPAVLLPITYFSTLTAWQILVLREMSYGHFSPAVGTNKVGPLTHYRSQGTVFSQESFE